MNSSIKKYIITIFYSFILIFSLQANEDIIKVINYNIHGLSPILAGDKNCNRIKFIFENSSKNYDLVLFQENWVYQKLLSNYFDINKIIIGNQTRFIKKNNSKRSNGLNIIANNDNIKIEESNEHLFDTCNGWLTNGSDCFVSKGFIHSRLRIRDSILNLFITHLDAGNSKNDVLVRNEQLLYLMEELTNVRDNEPIIICGDFNIDYYAEPSLIDDFIDKNNLTILRWDDDTDISNMIDFVFFKNGDNVTISLKEYGIDYTLIPYSDHPPIYFNFTMEKIK